MKNKKVVMALRIVLGLIFTVFGLNGFFGFLPMPELPEAAGALLGAFVQSGYLMSFVKGTEVVTGIMLLVGCQVPLALIMLAPVAINIFLFHLILVGPSTIGMPVIILVLMGLVASGYCENFKALCTGSECCKK